jgi:hypothetical protein
MRTDERSPDPCGFCMGFTIGVGFISGVVMTGTAVYWLVRWWV